MFFYFFTFVVLVLSVFFSFVFLKIRRNKLTKNVCIVVLGDVGRSPRMQNHTLSCVKAGLNVHLVGFGGKLTRKKNVHFLNYFKTLKNMMKVLLSVVKFHDKLFLQGLSEGIIVAVFKLLLKPPPPPTCLQLGQPIWQFCLHTLQ